LTRVYSRWTSFPPISHGRPWWFNFSAGGASGLWRDTWLYFLGIAR
jgi:hypothetical protein